GGTEVGDQLRRVRVERRLLSKLRDRAGHRHDHPRRRVHPGMSAAPGSGARLDHDAPREGLQRAAPAAPGGQRMSKLAVDRLVEKFPEAVVSTHAQHGDETVTVLAACLVEIASFLRDDAVTSFEMLSDLTAVDYLGVKEPRFEVVYHLYSLSK